MINCIIKLWNNPEMGRSKFFQSMVWLRVLFDIFGNATHATIWAFFIYLIYATLQLFLVRARVRNFNGNVKYWTNFFGSALVWAGVCLLLDIIAPKPLYHTIDAVFMTLTLFPIIYLCVYKPPKDGERVKFSGFFQKLQPESSPVRISSGHQSGRQ
jgi:hypothetical protein